MQVTTALFAALAMALIDPAGDEMRIEQLIHPAPKAVAAKTAKGAGSARAPKPADPAVALIGQKVRVLTVDRGLYAGTLQNADADNLTLRIELPKQVVTYIVPRSGVAALEVADSAP